MRRDGALRQHRQRGRPAGVPDRPRRDRPRHDRQVRGPLPRLARLRVRRPARPARTSRRGGDRGCGPRRPARTRRPSSTPRSCPGTTSTRSRRGWPRATSRRSSPSRSGAATSGPRPGYLEGLREICTRHGDVLIFDEIVSGFRVGPGGAQELFGVTPDLTTFAKAMANGFVIGAVAGPARPDGPARRRTGRPSRHLQRQRAVDGGRRGDPEHARGRHAVRDHRTGRRPADGGLQRRPRPARRQERRPGRARLVQRPSRDRPPVEAWPTPSGSTPRRARR